MTDYQPLITRAVEGLGKSTGEARRALYERARTALVAQLRAVEPALSEQEITKERLALEEAIRKVEAEAARKSRLEARSEPRFEPRPLRPPPRPAQTGKARQPAELATSTAAAQRETAAAAAPPPVSESPRTPSSSDDAARLIDGADMPAQAQPRPAPSARNRLFNARTNSGHQEGLKGFRAVVSEVDDLGAASAKAAQSARETRDSYESPLRRSSPADDELADDRIDQRIDGHPSAQDGYESLQLRSLEPNYESADEEPSFPTQVARPPAPRSSEGEDDFEPARPPRSYVGLLKLAAAGCLIGVLVAVLSWQWPTIKYLIARLGAHQPTQVTQAPPEQPKFSGRVPQEQAPGQAPGNQTPNAEAPPAVAQHAVLYEADPNDPQGMRYSGSVIWRTETVSPGPGLAPELVVRANIEIPERKMTVTWSLRRNIDKALPASHTIEIMFTLPPDFPGGGISHVPGIVMKQAEQAGGTPLSGLAVKVTDKYFLIGLSAGDAEQQRNVQLLKDQEWFDIPIVYANGARAILAVEKGPPGDRAFAEAFAAWAK